MGNRSTKKAVGPAIQLVVLVVLGWFVMLITHECGHIVGGWMCGGTLIHAELRPWRLPHSMFEPDPYPLVTLWAGPILGTLFPLAVALLLRRQSTWFLSHFCTLGNGTYLATAYFTADRHLDTTRLLNAGAHPASIALFCAITIGGGYWGFRRSCVQLLGQNERPADE